MGIQARRLTDGIVFIAIVAAGMRPPDGTSQAPPAPLEPTVHVYREVAGASLKAFVFDSTGPAAAGTRSAILLFHGGGWVAGSPEWTFTSARRYAAMGLVAVPVEYRLSSGSVTPIEAVSDVCAAFQWVRSQAAWLAIHPQRIAASGVSAGGHLAAVAGTIGCGNSDGTYGVGGPDALVLWSPALDVSGDGHFRRLLRDRAPVAAYSPVEHVRPRMPPVHIVHGERDTLTPLGGARRFCDRVRSGGGACELVVYPGVGHLLTRNLANQEDDFDPDPVAREDGNARQRAFIDALWPQ
jgi:acetyl esterase/lipase